jgi:hypothetical protein
LNTINPDTTKTTPPILSSPTAGIASKQCPFPKDQLLRADPFCRKINSRFDCHFQYSKLSVCLASIYNL